MPDVPFFLISHYRNVTFFFLTVGPYLKGIFVFFELTLLNVLLN